MNKRVIVMFVFLAVGLGLGLLAGRGPRALEGRAADDAGQTSSKGGIKTAPTGSSRYLAEMYQEKTRKRIEALKIPEAEQKFIDAAIEQKFAVREQLQSQSLLLFKVAVEPQSTDDELDRAVSDFLAAKDRFQRRVREIDDELVKRVSPRTRAKIMTTGALDNGLGFLSSVRPPAATTTTLEQAGTGIRSWSSSGRDATTAPSNLSSPRRDSKSGSSTR